jgi:hypothetical protein
MQRILQICTLSGTKTNNLVLRLTLKVVKSNATAAAAFNENVMIEINIDNTGDNVEDLVIQAIKKDDKMYFFGPYAPGTTGTSSTIKTSAASGSVAISKYGAAAVTSTQNGMKFSLDLETIHSFFFRSISSNSWRNCYSI